MLEQLARRCGRTEPVESDNTAAVANVTPPAVGDTSFDRQAPAHAGRQHLLFVFVALHVIKTRARHRNNACTHTVCRKLFRRIHRQRDL